MKRSFAIKGAAILGAAGLALAACSGGDGGEVTPDDDKTTDSAAPVDPTSAPPAADCETEQLIVGSVLPATGSLAFMGPPQFAGTQLAINEINEAGGVNGQEVEYYEGDAGDTSTNVAGPTVDAHLQKGANVIIGSASSAVTLSIVDKIVGEGVVQISPASTSPELTQRGMDGKNKGLFYRTAPPDGLQGVVVAQTAINDGVQTLGILALQDSYGTGISKVLSEAFEAQGGQVGEPIIYDPKAASFEAEVQAVKAQNPDGIALIGFDESKKILAEMMKQGVGPDTVQLYVTDGNMSNDLGESLPDGAMDGAKGTTPGAENKELQAKMDAIDPDLKEYNYGAESYDAVNLAAVAAEAAGCADGVVVAAKIMEISAPGNEECDSFASCKALLDEGKAISYAGPSGAVGLNEYGDPSIATMGVYRFNADSGKFEAEDFVTGEVPALESE